jgi:VIT1/CCC1 family predicted Fe2+/Mn2+ transporter
MYYFIHLMLSNKEKRNIRFLGVFLVLASVIAFFIGSGRGILVQYPYQVWGLPMIALGVAIVVASYVLPAKDSTIKD